LGIETIVCARSVTHSLGPQYDVIPVIPWLPATPLVAYVFGAVWVACGVGILLERTLRGAALALGGLLLLCTLVLIVPKNAADIANISLRTCVFEPLAIACLACLLASRCAVPIWLGRASRYLLAVSLIVFGLDHFLALAFIATLIPKWIPFHVFWVAFFGFAFIAAGFSIGLNFVLRWGAAGIGLMFGALGRHPAPPQSSWALWHSRSAAQPQRMVQPVHRHVALGRLVGTSRSASADTGCRVEDCRMPHPRRLNPN
jgi:uncharacterized membrane protein